jgi:hypothetical protein
MSDFCDFVPDDPSCTTAPEPELPIDGGDGNPTGPGGDSGPDGGKGDKDDWEMMEKMGKMDGNMSWEEVDEWLDLWMSQRSGFTTAIMTTVSLAAGAFLELFRYQSRTPDFFTSSAYVAGSGTDYYKLYHQYYGYSYGAMFTLLSISHILAWIGIGVNFDYFFAMVGAFFFFPWLHVGGSVLIALAYDNAYTVSQDTTSSYQSTALALMTTIQNEVTGMMAIEVSRLFEEKSNQDNWIFAHYNGLDDEDRDWWRN